MPAGLTGAAASASGHLSSTHLIGHCQRRVSYTTDTTNNLKVDEDVHTKMKRLADKVKGGCRRSLSRAITLVESTRPDHRRQAVELLDLLQAKGPRVQGLRVGVSGPPGAGKSTLLERLGTQLTNAGERVAVLAVDPSSQATGGSILGDKTRMPSLSLNPAAYVRPTPARGSLGGVARDTADVMDLCTAAGYSTIFVETVGVGQSEVEVASMVDCTLLVLPPAGGDELQGIKKGVVEIADILVVNKADGEFVPAAQRAVGSYMSALHLLRPRSASWSPTALSCSAQTGDGLPELWSTVMECKQALEGSGELTQRRISQVATVVSAKECQVMSGDMSARHAAEHITNAFFRSQIAEPNNTGPAL